jgi:uncharacterized membrane protein YccF (DUF307 family)
VNTIGNLIWLIFGGFFIFLEYLLGSVLLFISIIGIPFGIQTLKLAMLALMPFGKEVITTKKAGGCLHIILNIFWILICGIPIILTHLAFAFLLGITVIGIPFAMQHLKLAGLALAPFGREIKEAS